MPRSSADSSDEESKPPTAEEVDEFIRHNKVDESAAQDLRECPPEVQKRVLGRGDLNSARNPSAAVLVRIRDARVEERPSGRTLRPMGLPSSAEVNTYIKANGVNEAAAAALRGCSPTVKRAVLSSGDVAGAFDPSAALIAKIRDVKAGGKGNVSLTMPGMPPPMPTAEEIDKFIENNDLDESAEQNLKACPPHVIAIVLGKGDLRGTRNPSSAVLSRIRDAKALPPPMPIMPGAPFPGHMPPFGFPPPGAPFGYPHLPPGYPPPPGMYPPHPPGYPAPPGYYGPPGYPGPYGAAPPGPYGAPAPGPPPNGKPPSEYSYSYSSREGSRSRSRQSRRSSRSRSHGKKEKEKKEKKEKKAKEKEKKEKDKKKEKGKEKEKEKKEKKGKTKEKEKVKEKDTKEKKEKKAKKEKKG